jgi:hypothetical protein
MHRHLFTPSPPRDPAVVPSLQVVIPLSSIYPSAPRELQERTAGGYTGKASGARCPSKRTTEPTWQNWEEPGGGSCTITAATRLDLLFNAAVTHLVGATLSPFHACSWETCLRLSYIHCTTTSAVRLCSLSPQLSQQGYASRSSEPDVVKWLPSQINISSASSRPQKPCRESTCEVFAPS